jgi:hypothetical protein
MIEPQAPHVQDRELGGLWVMGRWSANLDGHEGCCVRSFGGQIAGKVRQGGGLSHLTGGVNHEIRLALDE